MTARGSGRRVLLLAAAALLLAACGGGSGDGGAGGVLAEDVDLSRVVPERVGERTLMYAAAAPVEDVLDGFKTAGGVAIAAADLAQDMRVRGLYQAVYQADAGATPDIVAVEVIRAATRESAARLLETVRTDPLEPGEATAATPDGFAADQTVARTIDPAADPEAAPLFAHTDAIFATLTVQDGNVVLRVRSVAATASGALASAVEAARAQQALLAEARAGRLQVSAVSRPYPRAVPDDLLDVLPPVHEGLQGASLTSDDTSIQAQYVTASGAFALVIIVVQSDPAEALLIGVLLRSPEPVKAAFLDTFTILDEQPLSLPAGLGEQATALRLRVSIQGTQRWDDVISFRRGPAWVTVQGVGDVPGGVPVESLALAIDQVLAARFGG